jgi:hypothetical protein
MFFLLECYKVFTKRCVSSASHNAISCGAMQLCHDAMHKASHLCKIYCHLMKPSSHQCTMLVACHTTQAYVTSRHTSRCVLSQTAVRDCAC